MARIPHFSHHRPESLSEALELLEQYGAAAAILAGGTEVIPGLRKGRFDVGHIISINEIKELRLVEQSNNAELIIGAGVRICEVAEQPSVKLTYPALANACTVMATTQIRNMGTVVGNIANASPCADTAGPLLVYDATAVVEALGKKRLVPLDKIFVSAKKTVLDANEMVTSIRVPAPPSRSGSGYHRLSARSVVDMAAASATAFLSLDPAGLIDQARLALGAVAPTPVRCPHAEKILVGERPDTDLLKRAALATLRSASPIDDVRATAKYRSAIVPVLARRALEQALTRAQGGKR